MQFDPRGVIELDFGLVLSGMIGLEYTIGNGRRCLAELFHAGDIVDTSRRERRQQGHLVALTTASLLSMDAVDLEVCGRDHPDMLLAYRHQIDEQRGRLRDHINDLAVKTPLERVVLVLFELRRWPATSRAQASECALPILRKDIAAYAEMKPETVGRALRRLLDAGLIQSTSYDRETITLLDPPALRQIANGGAPRGGEDMR